MKLPPVSDHFSKTNNEVSLPHPSNTGIKSMHVEPKTIIHWLTATFKKPEASIFEILQCLEAAMQTSLCGKDKNKGINGFTRCVEIHAYTDDLRDSRLIGSIGYGGVSQRDYWMLELKGEGCDLVRDWFGIRCILETLDARITRSDIALDFLNGEKTVDDMLVMVKAGTLNMNGRPPKIRMIGDWEIDPSDGRTLYIGKKESGKQLCIYEKGRSLGDKNSKWTRIELRLFARNRILPLEVLTTPDPYFTGAYPALEIFLDGIESIRIKTISKESQLILQNLAGHLKRIFGKSIYQTSKMEGFDPIEFLENITRSGSPKKLPLSSRDAKINWALFKEALNPITKKRKQL